MPYSPTPSETYSESPQAAYSDFSAPDSRLETSYNWPLKGIQTCFLPKGKERSNKRQNALVDIQLTAFGINHFIIAIIPTSFILLH